MADWGLAGKYVVQGALTKIRTEGILNLESLYGKTRIKVLSPLMDHAFSKKLMGLQKRYPKICQETEKGVLSSGQK